jgi:hypothetical protein
LEEAVPDNGNFLVPKNEAERLVRELTIQENPITISVKESEKQDIRGAFLRALLTEKVLQCEANDDIRPVSVPKILHFKNIRIDGKLDLSWCGSKDCPLPYLRFEDCTFVKGIDLTAAKLAGMSIERGFIGGAKIEAKGAWFGGDFKIKETKFEDEAQILLKQTTIESDCIFSGLQADLDANACARSPRNESAERGYISLIDLRAMVIGGDLVVEETTLRARDTYVGEGEDSKENEGVAINAEGAEIRGSMFFGTTKKENIRILGHIKISYTNIGGDIRIIGTSVETFDQAAILGDATNVKGGIHIESDDVDGCWITGVRFPEATVNSQIVIQGITVTSAVVRKIAGEFNDATLAKTAISIEGATVRADFFIQDDGRRGCFVHGEVDLVGACIEGQFAVQGAAIRSSDNGQYAIRADDSIVKGGFIIAPASTETGVAIHVVTIKNRELVVEKMPDWKDCRLKGEISLLRAVMGRVKISGAVVEPGGKASGKDEKNKHGVAIRASGAKIRGPLLIEGNDGRCCSITGSISLPGATVDGSLRIIGTEITAGFDLPAIAAVGATIKGGFYLAPSNGFPCEVKGEIRLSHAHIGTGVEIRGVNISSPDNAISANGADIRGDVRITSFEVGNVRSIIQGEVHLLGAHISGGLRIEGAELTATANRAFETASFGFAVDGYMAEIAQGVSLIPAICNSNGRLSVEPLVVRGIVGFAFAKIGSLTVGKDPAMKAINPAVILHGHLRLCQVQVRGATDLTQLELKPPLFLEEDELRESVVNRLKHWLPNDTEITALDAAHGDLGAELDINLSSGSTGIFELYGAKVGTLHDHSGEPSDSQKALGWGDPPKGDAWTNRQTRCRQELKGVCIRLNGFTYERFHEWSRKATVKSRLDWIRRQYPNFTTTGFFPQPYVHLAKVYREQGYFQEANDVTMERRWQEARGRHINRLNRGIQFLFGKCFGFGYSTGRALATTVSLLLLSVLFTLMTTATIMNKNTYLMNPPPVGSSMPSNTRCSHPWLYAIDQVFPLVHLETSASCELADQTPRPFKTWRVVIAIAGWICVPIALLTFSGVFREKD